MTDPVRRTIRITSLRQLSLVHVEAALVTYRGRPAVRLLESYEKEDDLQPIAIVAGTEFSDGIIETAIAGLPRPGASDTARGFVGIAFRVRDDGSRFEAFYLRPTNGRAEDQLRRNHSTQYMSHPEYPWFRLREESPGAYESYTDLVPAEWTSIKITVRGRQACLYVNKADQPCLVVNDLKLGESRGQLALWIGSEAEAYYSTRITLTAESGSP